jgi:hypothetical protein
MRSTCSAPIVFFHMIILILFGDNNITQKALNVIQDIISLTNCALLIADAIPFCRKTPVMVSGPASTENVQSRGSSQLPSSYLTSHWSTATKSNLYFASSFVTVVLNESVQWRLLTEVLNAMRISHCSVRPFNTICLSHRSYLTVGNTGGLRLTVVSPAQQPFLRNTPPLAAVREWLKARTVKPAETAVASERLFKHVCC